MHDAIAELIKQLRGLEHVALLLVLARLGGKAGLRGIQETGQGGELHPRLQDAACAVVGVALVLDFPDGRQPGHGALARVAVQCLAK
eukprot:692333-Alexandrium_andersonii.AAC.1